MPRTDILIRSVDLGGDTDTVAAIAMAPASVSAELVRDLPVALIDGLEDGPFGGAYLAELDSRLAIAFDAPIVAAGPRGGGATSRQWHPAGSVGA